jgi:hypothetical protein
MVAPRWAERLNMGMFIFMCLASGLLGLTIWLELGIGMHGQFISYLIAASVVSFVLAIPCGVPYEVLRRRYAATHSIYPLLIQLEIEHLRLQLELYQLKQRR